MLNSYLLLIRVLSDMGGRGGMSKVQNACSSHSKYMVRKMLTEMCGLGFVNRIGNQFELTAGGRALYQADSVAWQICIAKGGK